MGEDEIDNQLKKLKSNEKLTSEKKSELWQNIVSGYKSQLERVDSEELRGNKRITIQKKLPPWVTWPAASILAACLMVGIYLLRPVDSTEMVVIDKVSLSPGQRFSAPGHHQGHYDSLRFSLLDVNGFTISKSGRQINISFTRGLVEIDFKPDGKNLLLSTATCRIKVTGTRFMVNQEAGFTEVLLAAGSIQLQNQGKALSIYPGQFYSTRTEKLSELKLEDTNKLINRLSSEKFSLIEYNQAISKLLNPPDKTNHPGLEKTEKSPEKSKSGKVKVIFHDGEVLVGRIIRKNENEIVLKTQSLDSVKILRSEISSIKSLKN